VNYPELEQCVWDQMDKRQRWKYRKTGVIPRHLKRQIIQRRIAEGAQLQSVPLEPLKRRLSIFSIYERMLATK